jgi:hypothetical protein
MKFLTTFSIILVAVLLSLTASPSSEAQNPPVNSKIQDPNTKFFGVFAGTDGDNNTPDVRAELDPCRFDGAVGAWPGWAASRTTVLTEKGVIDNPPGQPPCDQNGGAAGLGDPDVNFGTPNGQATETNFRNAINALKPGGGAADKPVAGNELVVFVSAHAVCGELSLEKDATHDGKITAAQLRDLLSGFPKSVTITVILSVCRDGFHDALMGIRDDQGQALGPGHIEVLQGTRSTGSSFGGSPVQGAGSYYTTALVDCLANKGGKTVADVDFGNNDGMTWSLELHVCAGPLTTLISAYCWRRQADGKRIADVPPFGNNDDTAAADETSQCALQSWLGGKAAIQALINKAKAGPDAGAGAFKQHPTFKELGDPDKDPNNPDIDGDGISNVDEIKTVDRVTNPWKTDTDADGLNDKADFDFNCDPVDPDTDDDGPVDSDDVPCGLAKLGEIGPLFLPAPPYPPGSFKRWELAGARVIPVPGGFQYDYYLKNTGNVPIGPEPVGGLDNFADFYICEIPGPHNNHVKFPSPPHFTFNRPDNNRAIPPFLDIADRPPAFCPIPAHNNNWEYLGDGAGGAWAPGQTIILGFFDPDPPAAAVWSGRVSGGSEMTDTFGDEPGEEDQMALMPEEESVGGTVELLAGGGADAPTEAGGTSGASTREAALAGGAAAAALALVAGGWYAWRRARGRLRV